MNADTLNQEFTQAASSVDNCRDCGLKCILRYEPGVTYIFCLGCKERKTALPDWQPTEILNQWND